MSEIFFEKPLNGNIPEPLLDMFTKAQVQSGMNRKRAVAAAAYGYAQAEPAIRQQWWEAVIQNFPTEAIDPIPNEPSVRPARGPQTQVGRQAAKKLASRRGRKGGAG